ncbi:MAG: hypothetical protein ACFFC7_27865 [Candidatus Hermodarchaeota archaeon]
MGESKESSTDESLLTIFMGVFFILLHFIYSLPLINFANIGFLFFLQYYTPILTTSSKNRLISTKYLKMMIAPFYGIKDPLITKKEGRINNLKFHNPQNL